MTAPLTTVEIARAFSGHRFDEAFPYLADDVRWIVPGQMVLVGRQAVIDACRSTVADLADTETTFTRFVSVASGDVAVVDAVGRYRDDSGVTGVSSCDVYEFSDDRIVTITSYAVEVDPDDIGRAPGGAGSG